MYGTLFIRSPMESYLGCFQFLAIMYNTAVNICVQVSAVSVYCAGLNLATEFLNSLRFSVLEFWFGFPL